jgi:hypothetical protein
MPFTYDPTTDAGKVRLLARDTDSATVANQFFQDAEIDAFLALEGGDVKLAAADALDAIASSQTLLLKKVKLGDLGTDGPAVAAALREHAKTLRAQVYTMEPAFDIAEMDLNDFSAREILRNDFLRGL